jgi:hypothetical protein
VIDPEDEEWEFQPWTPEGADRLRAAAEAFASGIRAHAEAVIAAAAEQDAVEVFGANDVLQPLVLEYAEAQFEFTGTGAPFGELVLDDEDYDDEELEDDGEPVPELPTSGITVLQRRDYAVTDEDAIMAAGRAAYLQVWPDDDEDAAAEDVTHLGRALYQVAHAGEGFAELDELPGLVATGGTVVVYRQDELLAGEPDGWSPTPFNVDGEQLIEMQDVYI